MSQRDQERFLARLWAMERALVSGGFPAMPEWWRVEIARFYRSGKRRFVVRKGRRVFASTCVAPRLAVAEMLFGEHRHLPGTPALVFAFLSVKRGEATNRLPGVEAILKALGEPYSRSGQSIELTNRPARFEVITVNFRTAVGETVAFGWCDEVSRWRDDETGANPAEQVVSSLAPALATLPDARLFLVSSPLTHGDFHAKSFDLGETALQAVAFGETWTINPSLPYEACRAMEPNEKSFQREYGAIPSDSIDNDFFGSALDTLQIGGPPIPIFDCRYFIAIDQAFQKDRFGWAVCSCQVGAWDNDRKERVHQRVTIVHEAGAWKPDRSPREMARRLRCEVCERYQTLRVYADQYGGLPFQELADDVGIKLEIVPWVGGDGETSKATRYRSVRLAMHQGAFRVPDDQSLVQELRSVRSIITAAGNERIEVPRTSKGHGDRVSALVLAATQAMQGPVHLDRSIETFWERRARQKREQEFERLCSML